MKLYATCFPTYLFSDVLANDPTSVRSNIDVAKIYSSILPYNHRDTTFAMVCIKRALLFHPNSSKANHRMAVLLMSTVSNFQSNLSEVQMMEKCIRVCDFHVDPIQTKVTQRRQPKFNKIIFSIPI